MTFQVDTVTRPLPSLLMTTNARNRIVLDVEGLYVCTKTSMIATPSREKKPMFITRVMLSRTWDVKKWVVSDRGTQAVRKTQGQGQDAVHRSNSTIVMGVSTRGRKNSDDSSQVAGARRGRRPCEPRETSASRPNTRSLNTGHVDMLRSSDKSAKKRRRAPRGKTSGC